MAADPAQTSVPVSPKSRFRRWARRLFRITLIGLVLLVVLVNVMAYNHARAMMQFTAEGSRTMSPDRMTAGQKLHALAFGVNIPRPHGRATPLDVGLEYSAFPIPVPKTPIRLGAWYCPRAGARPDARTLVIVFHGYSADKTQPLPDAAGFHAMGCSVLLVDFRGSGDSTESYTTIGLRESEDVAAAVSYAKEHFPAERIVLYGQSMGAGAVFRAVARDGVTADLIICENSFDTMKNTVANRFRVMGLPEFPGTQLLMFWGSRQLGEDAWSHNPVDYASAVRCPVLFLQGTRDPFARLEDGRRVADATAGPTVFVELPSVCHEPMYGRFPRQWEQAVAAFLNSPPGPPAR